MAAEEEVDMITEDAQEEGAATGPQKRKATAGPEGQPLEKR